MFFLNGEFKVVVRERFKGRIRKYDDISNIDGISWEVESFIF